MKITSIKQQVKQPQRYSIYVDGEYAFSLTDNELLQQKLYPGQELWEKELSSLKIIAACDKAYQRCLKLLAIRARSEWEIRNYLKRKEYNQPIIEQTVERLHHHAFIDDKAFAVLWVENRQLLKSLSKRRLTQELRQKHIEDAIIQEVLTNDQTNDLQSLRVIVDRKKDRYPNRLKFMQYLSGLGFNYDDIKNALDDISSPEQ